MTCVPVDVRYKTEEPGAKTTCIATQPNSGVGGSKETQANRPLPMKSGGKQSHDGFVWKSPHRQERI